MSKEECEALKCLRQSHQKEINKLQSIQKETELVLAEILRYHITNCIYHTLIATTDAERQAFRLLGWNTDLPMLTENADKWIKERKILIRGNKN